MIVKSAHFHIGSYLYLVDLGATQSVFKSYAPERPLWVAISTDRRKQTLTQLQHLAVQAKKNPATGSGVSLGFQGLKQGPINAACSGFYSAPTNQAAAIAITTIAPTRTMASHSRGGAVGESPFPRLGPCFSPSGRMIPILSDRSALQPPQRRAK